MTQILFSPPKQPKDRKPVKRVTHLVGKTSYAVPKKVRIQYKGPFPPQTESLNVNADLYASISTKSPYKNLDGRSSS